MNLNLDVWNMTFWSSFSLLTFCWQPICRVSCFSSFDPTTTCRLELETSRLLLPFQLFYLYPSWTIAKAPFWELSAELCFFSSFFSSHFHLHQTQVRHAQRIQTQIQTHWSSSHQNERSCLLQGFSISGRDPLLVPWPMKQWAVRRGPWQWEEGSASFKVWASPGWKIGQSW